MKKLIILVIKLLNQKFYSQPKVENQMKTQRVVTQIYCIFLTMQP